MQKRAAADSLRALPLRELRTMAAARGIRTDGMVERAEFEAALAAGIRTGARTQD